MINKKFISIISLIVLSVGCATIDESSFIKPGETPKLETTEGGLWMQMEKFEEKTKTSGLLVKDKKLNTYIKKLVCNLANEYCPDIRVYIQNVPQFNASMAPNGMMNVWTGLLLRAQNESQLVSVLGHEIGHYIKKHSIKRHVDLQNKANFFALFTAALAGTGVYYRIDTRGLHDSVLLAVQGSIAAYSRDHEREADIYGLDLLLKEGYSPEGAPEIWENLIKENEAGESGSTSIFLATHPAPEERIENLRKKARESNLTGTPRIGEKDFLENTLPHRAEWFLQELEAKKFAEMQIVLKNLAFSPLHQGELHFLQGELIRKERGKDYSPKAIAQYQKAIDLDPLDPRPRKAIGLLLLKTDQKKRALENLKKYLELKPEADDRSMITSYLESHSK